MRFIITDCYNNLAHSKRNETHSGTSNLIFNFPNECAQIRLITAWKSMWIILPERAHHVCARVPPFGGLSWAIDALKATKCWAEKQVGGVAFKQMRDVCLSSWILSLFKPLNRVSIRDTKKKRKKISNALAGEAVSKREWAVWEVGQHIPVQFHCTASHLTNFQLPYKLPTSNWTFAVQTQP